MKENPIEKVKKIHNKITTNKSYLKFALFRYYAGVLFCILFMIDMATREPVYEAKAAGFLDAMRTFFFVVILISTLWAVNRIIKIRKRLKALD